MREFVAPSEYKQRLTMARFQLGGPAPSERAFFALLRAITALAGTVFVLLALLYSAYLNYTDMSPPEVDTVTARVEVDPTGRRVAHGRSWMARQGRLWHMHLEGSPAAIGDAHGRLTGRRFESLHEQVEGFLDRRYGPWVEAWTATMLMRWDYRGADANVRSEYRQELAALARSLPPVESGRLDGYPLLFLHQCFQELSQRLEDVVMEGTTFASRQKPSSRMPEGGNLIIGRNLTFDLGNDFDPDRIVAFYYPDGKYPFVSVGWAGLTGVVTGVNARGIFVGLNPARTDDPLEAGSPAPLILRRVLEEADTLQQAIDILRGAELRTSAIVLLGDGVQRKSVVMELAPRSPKERRVVRGEDQHVVWATDHMVREVFERDAQNDWMRRSSSSGIRYDRLQELLEEIPVVDHLGAARVLRDRRGAGNTPLGLGNHSAIENMRTTHSVIVDATAMVMWVSEGPSTLGRYQAFDLRHLLGRQGGRPAPPEDIPADPLLHSEAFRDYGEALDAIAYARELLGRGDPERALVSGQIALALAPDVGNLHRLLGDIERELGDDEEALTHYQRYLDLVPGRLRDRVRVEGIISELEGE